MLRFRYKNTDLKDQDNTPPEASNPTLVRPEESNLAKAHDEDFKTATMGTFKDINEDMNKGLNEDCGKKTAKLNNENNSQH